MTLLKDGPTDVHQNMRFHNIFMIYKRLYRIDMPVLTRLDRMWFIIHKIYTGDKPIDKISLTIVQRYITP